MLAHERQFDFHWTPSFIFQNSVLILAFSKEVPSNWKNKLFALKADIDADIVGL